MKIAGRRPGKKIGHKEFQGPPTIFRGAFRFLGLFLIVMALQPRVGWVLSLSGHNLSIVQKCVGRNRNGSFKGSAT